MDIISNIEAEQLLRRALKCLSAKCGTNFELIGGAYLVYSTDSKQCDEMALASIGIQGIFLNWATISTFVDLLHILLVPGAFIEIVVNRYIKHINFSKELGTSVDELKVNLDLLNA